MGKGDVNVKTLSHTELQSNDDRLYCG
jgi:hypothetical protein